MDSATFPATLSSRLARAGLWMLRGWQIEGAIPTDRHAVMLASPHTSNMDGLLLVLLTRAIGMQASWMVKDSWVKPPMGWVTRPVGAVPIDRSRSTGVVGQMVDEFAEREHFRLLIPPEGTRSRTDYWKSGFYQIAMAAGVPVIPTYVDYRRRRGGFGAPYLLTGDKQVDMDVFRTFYAEGAAMAANPDKYGPVRLRDE